MAPLSERTPVLDLVRSSAGAPPEDRAGRGARTDEELARAAQGGETSAFESLVSRFEAPLHAFLRVRTGNAAEAEELAQDAFLRAWEKLDAYDSRWRFSTWLFTLARNLAVSRARIRKARSIGDEELGRLSAGSDPARLAEARDEHENVWNTATRVLSREQRSALWLRYGEDLSIEEVADVLGRNRVTVRVILFRAREALASHFEREEERNAAGRTPRESVSSARTGLQDREIEGARR